MHHRPSSPPLRAQVSGALTRWSFLLRAGLRRTRPARLGRVALGALVTTIVVGLVLALPVISGVGAPAVELDSSSTTSPPREGSSPVVMGMDGRPVSSADSAGVTTSSSAPSSSAPSTTSGPGAVVTPAAPDEPSETVDAPAPGAATPAPAATPSAGGTTSTPSASPAPTVSRPPTPTTSGPAPAPRASAPAEPPVEVPDPAMDLIALVNAERADLGCAALVHDTGLATTAQANSAAMSASGVLGLGGRAGAVAQGPDARSVVAGWLADDTAALLLDCSRTAAGAAVVDGWWTTLVA